jgi:hypothetical protein
MVGSSGTGYMGMGDGYLSGAQSGMTIRTDSGKAINFGTNSSLRTDMMIGPSGNSQVAVAPGTAALPGLTFLTDYNTGMYRISSDAIGFSTGGTKRVTVTNGYVDLHNVHLYLTDGQKFYLDGGADTYLWHASYDRMEAIVGSSVSWFATANGMGVLTGDRIFLATDENTYIRESSDNVMDLVIGNSNKIRIESARVGVSGKLTVSSDVGFGTTDPKLALSIIDGNTTAYSPTSFSETDDNILFEARNITSVGVADRHAGIRIAYGPYGSTANASVWDIINVWKASGKGDLVFKTRENDATMRERVRFKQDGKVGIGLDNPATLLHVNGSTRLDSTVYLPTGGTEGADAFFHDEGDFQFKYKHEAVGQTKAGSIINADANTPEGLNIHYSESNPNNGAYPFLRCSDSTVSNRMVIYSNGSAFNVSGTWGQTSDIILKQDITAASSQWDDVKVLAGMGKNYRFIADVESQGDDATVMLGLVAQDVEEVSPGLVEQVETERDGLLPKTLKTSVMYMKAFLALGEALERIEALEAKVAALEAA